MTKLKCSAYRKNLISFLTQKLRNEKRASVYYSNVPNCIKQILFSLLLRKLPALFDYPILRQPLHFHNYKLVKALEEADQEYIHLMPIYKFYESADNLPIFKNLCQLGFLGASIPVPLLANTLSKKGDVVKFIETDEDELLSRSLMIKAVMKGADAGTNGNNEVKVRLNHGSTL
uniref:Uncharacterized protein n=1 Tax=Romanomermis culicivorax TaxID=13658 RepID=A0A915HKZ7_ROMCU